MPSEPAPPPPPAERTHAAFAFRAFRGSRDGLLRAVLATLETTPGLELKKRSMIWFQPAGPASDACLCAGIALDGKPSVDGMLALAKTIDARFADPTGKTPALRTELLWAHDPRGKPDGPPPPPHPPYLGPPEVAHKEPPPPLPPGRIVASPALKTSSWAIVPLAEVAPDALDPKTGDWLTDNLETVPPPALEQARPFMPSYRSETAPGPDGGLLHATFAADRAELLAAAAELMGMARPEGQLVDPATVQPLEAVPLDLSIPTQASDGARTLLWLRAVHGALEKNRQLRRAVVLTDGPAGIRGVLLCNPAGGGGGRSTLGWPKGSAVKEESPGRWRVDALFGTR